MLDVYHAPTTRTFRITWLLAELGVDYNLIEMSFYNDDRHQPAFRKISPMGSLPLIVDDGFALTESGAIINYLLRKYGQGRFSYADGTNEAALVDQWMYWSESLFAIYQRIYWDHCMPFPAGLKERVPKVGLDAKKRAIEYLQMLEDALGDEGYVVGPEPTGADFMLCFPLYLAHSDGWLIDHPKTARYVLRIAARPKFVEAIADSLAVIKQFEKLKAVAAGQAASPSTH
ncbi:MULTISPECIES: glutathione S-transferase family protein [unclassified Pseudomonas]|uniref:glutathione S-transferase family protein n=1 Tax=unclassified Pseudomonas TaxID=196821 RepID=UPI000871A7F3|nr:MULTISPECIES: glutathione S-transferase family protein [unclassified Pseudomonas]SCW99137.1 glutathione S-transferase [Pseudomonas sp. NFACC56-3]SFK88326.1 glutathione S-transferase [Pseudomonas sp. NFACC52]